MRVLLALTALTFVLGLAQKAPCEPTAWRDADVAYGRMCYSDLPFLYESRGFSELVRPYSDDPAVRRRFDVMEYPVGISYWAWGAAWVTHALSGRPDVDARAALPRDDPAERDEVRAESILYFWVNAVGLGLAALLTTWFLARTHARRPWDAVWFAATPALALTAMVNWDLLAVAAAAGALWAWSRGRPLTAGLLIGAGAAIKLYPLFVLGGVVVICLRERRWGDLARAAAATAVTWTAFNLPAYLAGPEDWAVFWTFNDDRPADLGSSWLFLKGFGLEPPGDLSLWSLVAFAVGCLAVLVLGLRAPETPRLAQLAFLVVACFLLVNKVYSPQYLLWLLPLAALARPRWRDQLIWQSSEVVYFLAVWWMHADPDAAGLWYWSAMAVRLLGELYLVTVVVRDVRDPERDPVRASAPPPVLAGVGEGAR